MIKTCNPTSPEHFCDQALLVHSLQPFLAKKHVVIPKSLEEPYYNRFVAPLIASFDDIEASGFEIAKHEYDPHPMLTIAELPPASSKEVIYLFNQH